MRQDHMTEETDSETLSSNTAAELRRTMAGHASDALQEMLDNGTVNKLSPRQRGLAYDTSGLLRRIAEGEIDSHPRIHENLLEIMTLAEDRDYPESFEEFARIALVGGALYGFSEPQREQDESKLQWRVRQDIQR